MPTPHARLPVCAARRDTEEELKHEVGGYSPEMKLTLFTNLGSVLTLIAFASSWLFGEDPFGGWWCEPRASPPPPAPSTPDSSVWLKHACTHPSVFPSRVMQHTTQHPLGRAECVCASPCVAVHGCTSSPSQRAQRPSPPHHTHVPNHLRLPAFAMQAA